MGHRGSGSHIYNIQRIILLVFYSSTCIALAVPLVKGIMRLSPEDVFPVLLTLILYAILVVIIGSLIHVISYIPFHLAHAFDPIQNDIASHRIMRMDQLGERITRFTVDFFDFSFLDIAQAFMQTEGSDIMGHEPNRQVEEVLKEYQMLQNSQALEGITRAGEIELPEGNFQLYILPIRFENQWLGYLALISKRKISRFFQRFLMEYEDDFLDDQVMHLMSHEIS
jgi:hypothetical protein